MTSAVRVKPLPKRTPPEQVVLSLPLEDARALHYIAVRSVDVARLVGGNGGPTRSKIANVLCGVQAALAKVV